MKFTIKKEIELNMYIIYMKKTKKVIFVTSDSMDSAVRLFSTSYGVKPTEVLIKEASKREIDIILDLRWGDPNVSIGQILEDDIERFDITQPLSTLFRVYDTFKDYNLNLKEII